MHPVLLTLGHFAIPTYGVLVAVAALSGVVLTKTLARRTPLDPERIWTLGALAIASAIFGAKGLLVLNLWPFYRDDPWLILPSGGVFLGGVVLAFAVCVPYAIHARLPLLPTMDLVAPALAIGQGIGRIGCFAAGCCYGRPIGSPGNMRWGLTFTDQIAAQNTGVPLGIPLYPTQLLESAACLLIGVLLLMRFWRPHRVGELMALWLFLYGLCRYFLEFYRGDTGRGSIFGGSMTVTQLLACGMVAVGGSLLLFSRAQIVSGKSQRRLMNMCELS